MQRYNDYMQYIEDICFFEVNTKYISSNELKTSEFSRVRIINVLFTLIYKLRTIYNVLLNRTERSECGGHVRCDMRFGV